MRAALPDESLVPPHETVLVAVSGGADSLALLSEAARRVNGAGWHVGNVDATLIAQAPKLAPHIAAMRHRIAGAIGVGLDQVSVKAKTAEGMGPVGRGESMEARAVCLIFRN